jgi:hypothetical protein
VFGVRGVLNCFLPMFRIMLGHGTTYLVKRFQNAVGEARLKN